jgi:predicted metal-dependent hydrolase
VKYKVIKSWRKTLSLTVKYGEIIVKAPYLTSQITIENFLHKNRAWIDKRLSSQKDIMKLSDDEILNLKIRAKKHIPERVQEIANKF